MGPISKDSTNGVFLKSNLDRFFKMVQNDKKIKQVQLFCWA